MQAIAIPFRTPRCPWLEATPSSTGAISIPFGMLPVANEIRGPRYRVEFNRVVPPRLRPVWTMDETQDLRSALDRHDIGPQLAANAIRDFNAEYQGEFAND